MAVASSIRMLGVVLFLALATIGQSAAAGQDKTQAYDSFIQNGMFKTDEVAARFAEVLPELKQFRVLIVPSYLSDMTRMSNELGATDYFVRHVEWLREAGVDVKIARIESEASVAANAGRIASEVRESELPVCLLTHSKGGLDALDFLVHASDADRSKVACWISLQAPFRGTPLADIIANTPVISDLFAAILQALGGESASLDDLTTEGRAIYLTQNAPAIQHVLAEVPTICLASVVENPEAGAVSDLTARTLDYLYGRNLPSDGVVPRDSAILPGAAFVVARNVDHTATVGTPLNATQVFDAESMLKVLYILLLGPEWT